MRILLTTDFLDRRNIGGAGRVLLAMAAHLESVGHEVTVLAGEEGGEGGEAGVVEHDGALLRWVSFSYHGGPRRGLRFLARMRAQVGKALRDLRRPPDVVIHNQPLTALACHDLCAPAIYIFHSPWPLEYVAERFGDETLEVGRHGLAAAVPYAVRRRLERRALRGARIVVTLSEVMRSHAVALHGIAEERLRLVPGGVNVAHFHPGDAGARGAARAAWGIEENELLLVAVRRLIPRTGVDLLLEAVSKIRDRLPNLRLLVAGSGSFREALEASRAHLGLESMARFVGYVPDDGLPDLYRAADLAVMPTRALEGFGLSTLEALACGTPVAATPVGGSVEILTDLEPRLLARRADAEALGELLEDWLSSPDRLRSLRSRCRGFVEQQYSWSRMGETIAALVHEATRADRGVRDQSRRKQTFKVT